MIGFFARHPTAANLMMLAIIALGITALPQLKRETFPEFTPSKLQISVPYPGASTEESELALCIPLEDAIDGINDIEQSNCEAREGIALMTIEMVEGGNIARLLSDVKTEIDAIDNFPDQAEPPILKELGRETHLITLAVTADLPDAELKTYAESIKDELQLLPGISMIDVVGFSEQQLRVELSLPLLRQFNLSVNDVVQRIGKQNIKLPSGNLKSDGKTTLLRFDQRQVTSETLAQLVIASTPSGGQIRLKDIANIRERFEKDEAKVEFNGQPAALLKIKKNKAQDALDLVGLVYTYVDAKQPQLPDGVNLTLTQDSAQVVEDRLNMLVENAWMGFILVFLVMWLFFAWRYSFWVSMGLPVSFLGSFWLMIQLGVSINMISMVALLMAIGILMDDAIVLAESVAAKIEAGEAPEQGVVDGVTRVATGVLSSFLTTGAVFFGLIFISGDIGQVMRVFPIVLLSVLVVSLVEAFFILPNHLLHSLQKSRRGETSQFKQKFQRKFDALRTGKLVAWVETAVTYRYTTVGATLALFVLSISLMATGAIKFKAFPAIEGDTLEMRLLMPQGTPIANTRKIAKDAVAELMALNAEFTPLQPDAADLVQNITVEYNNADANESGTHLATIRANLLTAEIRNTTLAELKQQWRQAVGEIPGALSLSYKEPSFGPAGRPFEIRIHGENLQQLSQASQRIQSALKQYDGVFDVMDDFRPGKQEWLIELLPGSMAFGVDGEMIANQLRTAYFGAKADEYQRGNDTLEVDVRLRAEDRRSLAQLQNYPITLADGTKIPLSAVAKLTPTRGYARINRVQGQRTITVIGDIDPERANTQEIITQLQTGVITQVLDEYPGLRISYEGEVKEGGGTSKSIVGKFMMGMVGVFIILSFQFRSYQEPIMVMLAIPLALIGSLWGHLLLGYDFTIPSMIGFVSLAGIVVNDSILLVAYIKEHQRQGMDIHDSVVSAARDRFRAVFITTATTVAGMMPLLLETSLQAQVLQPLVVSLTFGIATSTLLILFVLPCLYCIFEDWGWTAQHHLQADPKTAESI